MVPEATRQSMSTAQYRFEWSEGIAVANNVIARLERPKKSRGAMVSKIGTQTINHKQRLAFLKIFLRKQEMKIKMRSIIRKISQHTTIFPKYHTRQASVTERRLQEGETHVA